MSIAPPRDALSNAFKSAMKGIDKGQVLIPLSYGLLLNPDFKGFTIEVEPWSARPYDGKFHPSTHASWTPLQLMLYLTSPKVIEYERMELTSILAITQGKLWHNFWQGLWLQHSILSRAETPLRDPVHNRVGHMDGELSGDLADEALEIKTINGFQLPKIVDAGTLREKKPEYYAQTQDYLDMCGLKRMRYFLMATAFPFEFGEFVVPANPEFQAAQRAKYRWAIDAAAGQRTHPQPCCALGSAQARGCPVRRACDIGRNS